MQSRINRAVAALAAGSMDTAKLANIVGVSSKRMSSLTKIMERDGLVTVSYRYDKTGRHAVVGLVRGSKQAEAPKHAIYYSGKLAS